MRKDIAAELAKTKSRKLITFKPDAFAELERQHKEREERINHLSAKLKETEDEKDRWFMQATTLTEQLKSAREHYNSAVRSAKESAVDATFWRGVAIGIDPGRAEAAERIRQGRPPRDAGSGRIVMDQKGEDPSNGIAWRNKAF